MAVQNTYHCFKKHPENGILIKSYYGDKQDKELKNLF